MKPEEEAMRFSYRLIKHARGWVAECLESDAEGEGKTAKDAVESLKMALEERMFRPDAIAPPPETCEGTIELVLSESSTREKLPPSDSDRQNSSR